MTKMLDNLRVEIDNVDNEILQLITRRAELAQAVAKAKNDTQNDNDVADPVFYRPEREAAILRRIQTQHRSPLPDETVVLLFRELISACLALQKRLKIAYLGPKGTYSQAAVMRHFGHAVDAIPVPSIDEVFREVEAGNADYGMVPTENSTEGGVNQTLDCLLQTQLRICGETAVPVHQHLLSSATDISTIKRVYSHQQSLGQCRVWLDTQMPNVERIAVSSNAEAARRATQESDSAAIAGQLAAELYALNILAPRVEDHANNTTLFVVLGRQSVPSTGQDKTSYVLSSRNQPGALHQLLGVFATNNINMTRIESRPNHQGMWEYMYFIDIEGHIQDPHVARADEQLKNCTAFVKHLGSYPRTLL